MDLGDQVAYLALADGTAVFSADEERIGTVSHVLADEQTDIFDGLVIREGIGRHRFVDQAQIDAIYERGVVLNLDAAACADLPEPSANPAVMGENPADRGGVSEKLARAWDRISGNY